jgi:TatD DNase family protein
MSSLPAMDVHAHIDPTIDPQELLALRAAIFAATRSLDVAQTALRRADELCVWGVGVHPGVTAELKKYDDARFSGLLDRAAYVSEVGLDGRSPTRLAIARDVLRSMLDSLAATPRIVCLHSYAATGPLIEELEARPIPGAVLHWWLGTPRETDAAIALGAYVSVNASSIRKWDGWKHLPLDRLLTETDHPSGDKFSRPPRRPGAVEDVEQTLAANFGMSPEAMRLQIWRNLARLVSETSCAKLLPARFRTILGALPL